MRLRVVVLLSGACAAVSALRLDELGPLRYQALDLSRRHRCAAFADLSSDKERLGSDPDVRGAAMRPRALHTIHILTSPRCFATMALAATRATARLS